MMTPYLKFEQVADKADLSATTLRYYIRLGLLPKARRTPAGRKEYPVSVLSRIAGIRRAKNMGFTLQEIKELFSEKGWEQCLAEQKIEALDEQIAHLVEQRDALEALGDDCPNGQRCALVAHIMGGETWTEPKTD